MPLQGSNLNSSESKSDVLPITPRGNKLVGPCGYAPLPFTDRFYRPIAETIGFRTPYSYHNMYQFENGN